MRSSVIRVGAVVLVAQLGSSSASRANAVTWPTAHVLEVSRGLLQAAASQTVPPLQRIVSLDARDIPLGDVLKEINRQARLGLAYSPQVVPLDRHVTLRATKITAGEALARVLKGTGARAREEAGTVFLEKEDGKRERSERQDGTIVGQMVDSTTRRGVSGVDVFLDGTRWHTATDTAGRYRLAEIEPGTYTLVARRPGYAKQSRKVTVESGQVDTVDVALAPVAVSLNELVTTATGQQRRRDLGNAITTIHADSVMEHAPIRSLTDLLQNRVPGLTVQHTTGAPGDPAKLRLRGLGSIMRSNDPVVVIDGVRVYSAQTDARSGNLTNALAGSYSRPDPNLPNAATSGVPAPSPLDQIDPNIIEKIEVFKGPSAATMYGADAANGVIVITTKRGKPGPTRWSATLTHGRTDTPGRYPVGYYRWGHGLFDGSEQFCELTSLSCVQDSLVLFQALNEPSLTVLGQGRRTALALTASGGTQALTYSVTGSYSDELGLLKLPDFEVARFRTTFNKDVPDWMRRPQQYTTWSVTSNVTARLNAAADVSLLTTVSRSQQQRTALENQISALMGTYVDTVNGSYYQPRTGYGMVSTLAFLHDYYVKTTASTLTLTTGLSANWRPRSWFTAFGQAGLNFIPRDDHLLLPAGLVAPNDSGTVTRGTGQSLVSTFELRGQVRRPLGHGFVFLTDVGTNLVTSSTTDLVSRADRLLPGTTGIAGAKMITAVDDHVSTSVFGWYLEPKIQGQRLSLSTGLRLDGGSAYGARLTGFGGQGGGFLRNLLSLPKLNGSWVISEEPFFPAAFKSVISSLRLRAAYGQAQVQPGAADRLRLYSRDTANAGFLALTSVGNIHLRPERSTEIEGGFDADLLDSRLTVELTAYRKMQVDALMSTALPGSINGGGSIIRNIGNIKNTGLELTVAMTPVRLPGLTWSTQLGFQRNRNQLVKLGSGVEENRRQGIVAGYPVGSRWVNPIVGFGDQNGDGILERAEIQVGDSLVYAGRLYPDYQATFNTNVALFNGAVGLSADFSYNAGQTQKNQMATTNWVFSRGLVDPSSSLREQAAVLAFTEVGYQGAISPSTDYGLLETISTLRFNTLSVNYRAPARLAKLLHAERLSIAVQGQNLGLHSTYRGKDPDVNVWSPGEGIVDIGQLPQPRTWQLRVDLQY